MSQQYYVVAATSELEEDGQIYIELNGEEILLCKHRGEYHAIAYYCSHEAFTLEGGTLHNGCITCPYHGAEFALSDGSAEQFETDLVSVEIDICCSAQSAAEADVILKRDNAASYGLIGLGQFVQHIPHVALDLADDGVAGPTFFQLDDQQLLLVLANRQNVDWAGVRRELLTCRFTVLLEDVICLAQLG